MIFISGIHAVGKGYFCGLVKKELGIEAYSASDLMPRRLMPVSVVTSWSPT